MRRFLALLICVLSCAPPALALDYPNKPIRIIVPFGPGGGGDIVGRIFGQALQEKLGQPVVIENKPGAAGTIGNEAVARADRDGYTIGVMTAGQIIAGAMNKSLRYDTATAFEPISMVATASLMIVARPDFPANNAKELIAAAKANPGKINVASPGFGATQHMSGELFKQTAGVNMVSVQFRTSPEAITAVLGKQVDVLFDTVLAVLGQVQSGQLKAIAVTTKDEIANAFGVPLAFLTTETNLANLQAAMQQHSSLAIRPRLQRRDEKINEQLIPLYDPTHRLFVASDDPMWSWRSRMRPSPRTWLRSAGPKTRAAPCWRSGEAEAA